MKVREDSAPPTRFVVFAAPRTGSNWLCTLLDSHPEILCHHEIFNPGGIHYALSHRDGSLDFGGVEARDREPLEVLAEVWRQAAGHPVVGFKHGLGQDRRVFAALFADRGVRKIVIRRAHRLRTYVSERIAQATGEWESYPGMELSRPRPVTVDAADLAAHAARNGAFYRWIGDELAATGQEALDVLYERLADEAEHRRIQRFLGFSAFAPLRGATRKQNPGALCDLIANYDDLASALGGSDLGAELRAELQAELQAEPAAEPAHP